MLAWYTYAIPEEKIFIDQKEAEQYLRVLVGKPARLSCGYGGVLFLEAGKLVDEKIEGRVPPLFRGNYRLFCNEVWEFTLPSGTKIARFTSSSTEDDQIFWQMGERIIEKIDIEGTFEKTHIHFAGGYRLTIFKEDELETFHFTLQPEKKILSVNGNGAFELETHTPTPEPPYRPRQKKSPTIELDREELKKWSGDLFPVSSKAATQFVATSLGHPLKEIIDYSATTFVLRFGPDIGKKSQKRSRWQLSVDELWILSQDDNILLDAKKDKFEFIEKLRSFLLKETYLNIHFEDAGKAAQLTFSNNFIVQVKESGRYTSWTLHDYFTGLSITSYRDEGLLYRLSIPDHLQEKYKSDDIHLSHIHYQLDFLRESLAK